jgi:hypothetical protein
VRPVLLPALRRLWRDRETLQLGRAAGSAVVLAGLDENDRQALTLLDGTRDAERVLADAADAGCRRERAQALLALLDEAGVLVDAGAPALLSSGDAAEQERLRADVASLLLVRGRGARMAAARRRAARVRVAGAGRVGSAVAGLLACAGVGALDVDDAGPVRPQDTGPGGPTLADVGRSRGEATRDRLRALAPSVDLDPGPPHLVVVAPAEGSALDDRLASAPPGTAHLLAEVRDTVGVVGPLVLPGTSACLQCVDLTRTDLDPDWPALATQLAHGVRGPLACDGVLAVAVAAQAAAQVLAVLDGAAEPATVGGTLELALPDWRWRRRSWVPHAACGCVRVAG